MILVLNGSKVEMMKFDSLKDCWEAREEIKTQIKNTEVACIKKTL